MMAKSSTGGTDSSERCRIFRLRKAVKMIQTKGQDIENTTLLDDSDSSKSEEEETVENTSNSEPEQADRDVGVVSVWHRQ